MDVSPKEINSLRLEVESKLAEWVKGNQSRRHVVTTYSVAKQIGVSTKEIESYFEHIIKIRFDDWLTILRAIDAREVIQQHVDWDDSRVADYVGFDSAKEMISAYVRINGMAPSDWRDRNYSEMRKMPPHIERIVNRLNPYITEWESNKGYCNRSISKKALMEKFDTYDAEFELYYSFVFQTSFEQRLEQLRIDEAKRIMTKNPSATSSEIADLVGFSGSFAFEQIFHRRNKQTTTEWKIGQGLIDSNSRRDSFPFDDEPVVEWIQKKGFCSPRLTIKVVARQLGFSENRLAQFLWLTENCSFEEWIDKLKLEEAKRLLSKRPRLNAWQVEERIGYSSKLPFAKWFENQTGKTPENWP